MRICATIILSIAFLVLLVTGTLLYSTPYDYFTSSLHTWASIFLVASLLFHFYNNWGVYKRHLAGRAGKVVFLLAVISIVPLSYAIVAEKRLTASVIEFGEKLRSSGSVRDGEFEIIDLSGGVEGARLELFVKSGAHYTSNPQPLFLGFTYTATPQIVIWLETLDGQFVKTLYLTNKSSNSGFQSPSLDQSAIIRRPEALPYWGHRRGVQSADGLYLPEAGSVEFDGLTAPTPRGDHHLILPGLDQTAYKLMLEVNRSYDFNAYYSRGRFPDDPVYSGSGSSGQPSLVYEATINLETTGEQLFALIGRGHHSGQDGVLYTDLENMTSAKDILSFVVAKISKTQK